MRLFTLHELLRVPHAELVALRTDVERQLAENLCDRQIALANLRLINCVLSRCECDIDRWPLPKEHFEPGPKSGGSGRIRSEAEGGTEVKAPAGSRAVAPAKVIIRLERSAAEWMTSD